MPKFATHQLGDKFIVTVRDDLGHPYVFRYAYDNEPRAKQVARELNNFWTEENYGQPLGVATDLAYNYWKLKYMVFERNFKALKFVQRTTQKNSWYIPQPEY